MRRAQPAKDGIVPKSLDVLLADQTDRNRPAVGIDDGRSEQRFEHE